MGVDKGGKKKAPKVSARRARAADETVAKRPASKRARAEKPAAPAAPEPEPRRRPASKRPAAAKTKASAKLADATKPSAAKADATPPAKPRASATASATKATASRVRARTPRAGPNPPTPTPTSTVEAVASQSRANASPPSGAPTRRPAKRATSARPATARPGFDEAAVAARTPAKRAPTSAQARVATPAEDGVAHVAEVATSEGAILVTGICGRLGRLLARKLHRQGAVLGIDRRPFPGKPKDIVFHQIDIRRKKTRDLFRQGDIRAVVHLGVLHDLRKSDKEHHSWNVVAFQKLLDYLAQYAVPKLVVLSSANVYGPQPDNPQFLTEEAPLLGAQAFRGIRDLVEMDMLAQSFFWRHPATETVILRPCHILGAVKNAPSNYLRLERPMTVMGFDPMIQVIHERDVVDAITRALDPGIRGIFNIKGPGELPLSRIFALLGRKPVPVPGPVARGALDRLWRYRLTSFPTPELDHIRYVCMVDDSRARETLGFVPRHGMRETLAAVTDG